MINYLDALKKSAANKSTKSVKDIAKNKQLYALGKHNSVKDAYLEEARINKRSFKELANFCHFNLSPAYIRS